MELASAHMGVLMNRTEVRTDAQICAYLLLWLSCLILWLAPFDYVSHHVIFQAADFLKAVDCDGSGEISFEEFEVCACFSCRFCFSTCSSVTVSNLQCLCGGGGGGVHACVRMFVLVGGIAPQLFWRCHVEIWTMCRSELENACTHEGSGISCSLVDYCNQYFTRL